MIERTLLIGFVNFLIHPVEKAIVYYQAFKISKTFLELS